jgi:hypothetical protein
VYLHLHSQSLQPDLTPFQIRVVFGCANPTVPFRVNRRTLPSSLIDRLQLSGYPLFTLLCRTGYTSPLTLGFPLPLPVRIPIPIPIPIPLPIPFCGRIRIRIRLQLLLQLQLVPIPLPCPANVPKSASASVSRAFTSLPFDLPPPPRRALLHLLCPPPPRQPPRDRLRRHAEVAEAENDKEGDGARDGDFPEVRDGALYGVKGGEVLGGLAGAQLAST